MTSLQVKLLEPLSLSPGVLRCRWCFGAWSVVLLVGLLDVRAVPSPRPGSSQSRYVGRWFPQVLVVGVLSGDVSLRVTPALKKELEEQGTSANKAWYCCTSGNLGKMGLNKGQQ